MTIRYVYSFAPGLHSIPPSRSAFVDGTSSAAFVPAASEMTYSDGLAKNFGRTDEGWS
jgi:hypothetical protein